MLTFHLVVVFLVGCAVGSFLNVCAYRIPYEKSVFWPGSHCGHCFQPVRWYDNIPLVSYWVLRGRCRTCGAPYSVRYFLVELFTASAFAALFYLVIARNALGLPFLARRHQDILVGWIPLRAWAVFFHLAVLLLFLMITSL